MDATSQSDAGPDEPVEASAPVPAPPPLNPRQLRARRRRRRRQFGTALFVVVAIGVLATAYFSVAGGDDGDDESATATSRAAATSTTAAFVGGYKVTTGVNVREGPGTSFRTVGAVETGRAVVVICVVEGELVDAPRGPDTKWLKVTSLGPSGYISAAFVSTGDDLRTEKIPTCTS